MRLRTVGKAARDTTDIHSSVRFGRVNLFATIRANGMPILFSTSIGILFFFKITAHQSSDRPTISIYHPYENIPTDLYPAR